MKARWNACYAIHCALSNARVASAGKHSRSSWAADVVARLPPLVAEFKNLKVRMRAAAAFTAIRERSDFGAGFVGVWSALCRGLDTLNLVSDFKEYQHVHGVVEQVGSYPH
jgi:hypothetical protein